MANGNGGAPQMTAQDLDRAQTMAVLGHAVEMQQEIFSESIDTSRQKSVDVELSNVGLIKRLVVTVEGAIKNNHVANDATATQFGIQNVIENFTFKDLNNNERINTNGAHIANVNTVKRLWPFASALGASVFGAPVAASTARYGNNFPVIANPLSVAHGGTSTAFRMVYEVPLSYSDDDLRGAIYGNVLEAKMKLRMRINQTPFVAPGTDDTFAIMKGGTCVFDGPLQITVDQVFLDQLPIGDDGSGKRAVILPVLSLSTVYELKESTLAKIVNGKDFPVSFANFRDFLSVFAIFNNSGDDNGHGIGQDVDTWSLQSANFTRLWQLNPLEVARRTRDIIGFDMPAGTYYFSFRRQPINTQAYGNMQLVLKALSAGAGAYLNIWWEDFALVNTLTTAGSLSSASS